MALDGAGMIASLGGVSYTVTRRAVSTVDSTGTAVLGGTSAVPIVALVAPLSGKDRALLPAGVGSNATLGAYTATQLFPRTEDQGGDRLTFQGDVYEVTGSAPWLLAASWVCALEKVVG